MWLGCKSTCMNFTYFSFHTKKPNLQALLCNKIFYKNKVSLTPVINFRIESIDLMAEISIRNLLLFFHDVGFNLLGKDNEIYVT